MNEKNATAKTITSQEFATEYQKLCDTWGYRVFATPTWIGRDDGTFSLIVNYSIGEMPRQ